MCEVTVLLQNEVNGGQLINYNLKKLQQQFNPCLNDTTRPWLMIVYIERGEVRVKVVECSGSLWLGGVPSETQAFDDLVKRGWNWLFPFLRIE